MALTMPSPVRCAGLMGLLLSPGLCFVLCAVPCAFPCTLLRADGPAMAPATFLRGDVNADGFLSQADVLAVVRYFYNQNLVPPCSDAADFDDSGQIDVTDLSGLVHFLYLNGRYPSPPYRSRGEDPTSDLLSCAAGRPLAGGGGGVEERTDGDEDDGQVIDFIEFFSRRMEGFPGQSGIRAPILLSNAASIDGFTVSVSADPSDIWLEGIDLPRVMPGRGKPEYTPIYTQRQLEGYLARSVFMDFDPPFEGQQIPRGPNATVAYLVFGISPTVKLGQKIRISLEDIPAGNDFRPTPMNEVCVAGRSIRPGLDGRGLEVTVAPKEALFIRGDPDRDFSLNITDVILIIRYLFISGVLPCLDPADVDDSGAIDISDAIALLAHLFGEGAPLHAPFPNPGLDPSRDLFPDCD